MIDLLADTSEYAIEGLAFFCTCFIKLLIVIITMFLLPFTAMYWVYRRLK